MDSSKFKYGIVFCGGGAKGAYQIGVWKCLRELGLDKEIIGISGASVGAMNSMLFAQGDYDVAKEVWMQIRKGDLTALNLPLIKAVLKSMLPCVGASSAASALVTILWSPASYVSLAAMNPITAPLIAAGAAGSVILGTKEIIPQLGLFTCEKLESVIQNSVNPIGITTTNKQVYTALTALSEPHLPDKSVAATDSAFPALKPVSRIEYRAWRNLTYNEIVETVLASAALPAIYPASSHKKRTYIDGGVLDNTPVKPLIDVGFRNIIIVHLEYLKKPEDRHRKECMIRSQGDSSIRFLHIWPSSPSIGNTPLAMLEIDVGLTRNRMNLGYMDTQSQLLPQLDQMKKDVQKLKDKKDAETHYNLASEIYKKGVRSAVLTRDMEQFRAFLRTVEGQAMLRNYEYAANLGHEEAEKIVAKICRLQRRESN